MSQEAWWKMLLKTLDPRAKFAVVLCLSTTALIYSDRKALGLVFVCAILLAIASGSHWGEMIKKLKGIVGVVLAIAVIQSLFVKIGQPLITVGHFIVLTDYGLNRGLEFVLRISSFIFSAIFLSTSSSREIVQGLVQMKLPYEIAFMVSISVRFLPLFKEEMTDMVVAIQLRGIDLKKIKWLQKIKVYQYLLLPMTLNALLRAKELSLAMEMRAFRAFPTRTSFRQLELKRIDFMVIGLCAILMPVLMMIN